MYWNYVSAYSVWTGGGTPWITEVLMAPNAARVIPNWDDWTWQVGRIDLPFATPEAAFNAVPSNGFVYIENYEGVLGSWTSTPSGGVTVVLDNSKITWGTLSTPPFTITITGLTNAARNLGSFALVNPSSSFENVVLTWTIRSVNFSDLQEIVWSYNFSTNDFSGATINNVDRLTSTWSFFTNFSGWALSQQNNFLVENVREINCQTFLQWKPSLNSAAGGRQFTMRNVWTITCDSFFGWVLEDAGSPANQGVDMKFININMVDCQSWDFLWWDIYVNPANSNVAKILLDNVRVKASWYILNNTDSLWTTAYEITARGGTILDSAQANITNLATGRANAITLKSYVATTTTKTWWPSINLWSSTDKTDVDATLSL